MFYVGEQAFSFDNLTDAAPLLFGLGTTPVANNDVGATDGTAHATISVAEPEEPESIVAYVHHRTLAMAEVTSAVATPTLAASRAVQRRTAAAASFGEATTARLHASAVDRAHSQVMSVTASRRRMAVPKFTAKQGLA